MAMVSLFSKGPDFDPKTDLVDLKGKVVVVTGGNRGIGYGTIFHLARAGAKVYMAARSEKDAEEAIERLKGELDVAASSSSDAEGKGKGNGGPEPGEVVWLKLDLSDPREAKKAAEEFLEREGRLDILVNNAGVQVNYPYKMGKDGIPDIMTINHISPFVFTMTLLPLMIKTAGEKDSDVRIVNVTSIAHKFVPSGVKFEEVKDFDKEYKGAFMGGMKRYGHSKLCNILFTKNLQKRLDAMDPPSPITVIAIHPGGVDTFSHTYPLPFILTPLVRLAINDLLKGSYTSVFAAAGAQVKNNREKYKAAYLESNPPGHFATTTKDAADPDLAEKCWTETERFLQGIGLYV